MEASAKESHNSEHLLNNCRTCLRQANMLHPLTKLVVVDDSMEISYGELVNDITHINIKEDYHAKLLPQYICDFCTVKLKTSHAFIRQVRDVNARLWSLCQQQMHNEKDCLKESEIDIESCLDIKLESDDNADDIHCDASNSSCGIKLKDEKNDGISMEEQRDSTENCKDINETANLHVDDSNKDYNDFVPRHNRLKNDRTNKQKRTQKQASDNEMETTEHSSDNPNIDSDIAVPCLQCNKIFNNSKELMRHLKNTHLPEDQKCACPICDVKFTRSCNMYKHMRKMHMPEEVKKHLPDKEKPFECDRCHRRYTQKRQLNCHIKEKHDKGAEEQPLDEDGGSKAEKKKSSEIRPLCFVCGSSFSNKAHLIVHMTRHTGEKPYGCDLCDRAFPRISDLTIHRRIHTGEKPFKCKLCDKAFRVSTKLANHMRSHTNERPYKCKQCERSFKYSKDLNIHMRIHTGERPYRCLVCGSTFTQSNSLKAHRMKLGHTEDGLAQSSRMQLVTSN